MQAVVLAAGACSRFWPLAEAGHKSLFTLMGRPLIAWTLEGLERAGVDDAIIVQSEDGAVEQALGGMRFGLGVRYVRQERPRGMGDAVLAARGKLEPSFFVIHAHQFDVERWIGSMLEKRQETDTDLVLTGRPTDAPWNYGILELDGDRAMGIVEKPDPVDAPSTMRAMGIYLLPGSFVDTLESLQPHEYAFEDALDAHMKEHGARVVLAQEPSPSLKYPWDLFAAARRLMDARLTGYRAPTAGVSPLASVEGEVYIGENVRILEYAVVKGPCYIGADCVIGNHALVRDYTDLERGVVVGAQAEVARSLFQENASTHSGYFGDSILDRGARVGAGTVTANVKLHRDEIRCVVKGERVSTGLRSFGTVVGADTQLGISVNTMPGVLIGPRTFVGPGTLVDENVPADSRYAVKQEKTTQTKRHRPRRS